MLSHLRLVVSVARGYLGYGLPHADLIQEGNVGLMKAVKRFDPERGVRLVSFAIHWIKAEIHEYILRNWRLVKVATTKAQRKLFFNLRSMKSGLRHPGAATEVARMATTLNVKPEEVVEMETRLPGHDIALEPRTKTTRRASPRSPTWRTPRRALRSVLERARRRALGSDGLEAGAGEPRCAQPPHRRGALADTRATRAPCTSWPRSSACRPSASARSRRRRCRR